MSESIGSNLFVRRAAEYNRWGKGEGEGEGEATRTITRVPMCPGYIFAITNGEG